MGQPSVLIRFWYSHRLILLFRPSGPQGRKHDPVQVWARLHAAELCVLPPAGGRPPVAVPARARARTRARARRARGRAAVAEQGPQPRRCCRQRQRHRACCHRTGHPGRRHRNGDHAGRRGAAGRRGRRNHRRCADGHGCPRRDGHAAGHARGRRGFGCYGLCSPRRPRRPCKRFRCASVDDAALPVRRPVPEPGMQVPAPTAAARQHVTGAQPVRGGGCARASRISCARTGRSAGRRWPITKLSFCESLEKQ